MTTVARRSRQRDRESDANDAAELHGGAPSEAGPRSSLVKIVPGSVPPLVPVKAMTPADLPEPIPYVDLINLKIQGSELSVIVPSLKVLTESVRRPNISIDGGEGS